MADSKVSELTAATSVGGSDQLYLVQSNTSKRVTAATLFANAANVTLKGNITLDSCVQLLSSPGIIDTTKPITHLSVGATDGTLSIPSGAQGQLKIITTLASGGGVYSLEGNIGGSNGANVMFTRYGDTATLLFTDTDWYYIGGTANVALS